LRILDRFAGPAILNSKKSIAAANADFLRFRALPPLFRLHARRRIAMFQSLASADGIGHAKLVCASDLAQRKTLSISVLLGRTGQMKDRKYRSGQTVTMTPNRARATPKDRFEIVRLLPLEHGNYQYRIRSVADGHERVALETELN
jgi:hypothetical protein